MILAVDIGNTNTVLGLFRDDAPDISIRMATDPTRTADELELSIDGLFRRKGVSLSGARGSILSSVVPGLNRAMQDALTRLVGKPPIVVGPGVKTGLCIRYDDPREVGADRIVNAVGAYREYGGPLIIIDFGTATTYCVVDAKGTYLGGVIAPGLRISAEALFERAAKLPKVDLVMPDAFLHANTVDAMRAGIMFSVVGEVEYIVSNLKRELAMEDAKVIATGGLAEKIAAKTSCIDVLDIDLTLRGLKAIYEKNTPA